MRMTRKFMECSPLSFGHLLSSLLSNTYSLSCQLMTTVKVALSHFLNCLLMVCRTQPYQNCDKRIMQDKNKRFVSYSEYDENSEKYICINHCPGLAPILFHCNYREADLSPCEKPALRNFPCILIPLPFSSENGMLGLG